MSHPSGITTHAFQTSAQERLSDFLARAGLDAHKIVALTPDASTREYFRIPWRGHATAAVVAVYPEPFDPQIHPYLDVTGLFDAARLPVPKVLEVDGQCGLIVQEDMGDTQLRGVFATRSEDEREVYLERAISLIAQIQAATPLAYERDSIASRLAFDEAKLSWELDYFLEHYFKSYRHATLPHTQEAEVRAELNDLVAELAARPRVLCHRDYHASNLLLDRQNRVRIIDHQDARMGPASYDLVSLLLDRQTSVPSLAEIRGRRLFFLEERRALGLDALDPDDFAREFRLMTVQRCLKAVGTFSYQSGVCGRGAVYEHFIEPMLKIVIQAIELLGRFPVLRDTLRAGLNPQ